MDGAQEIQLLQTIVGTIIKILLEDLMLTSLEKNWIARIWQIFLKKAQEEV